MTLIAELLQIALTAAPWLLLGLVIAGMIKAWLPESLLQRWMGGRGLGSIVRAAVIGMPLPLCSCGAIPTAIALHRGGAGRGPTTSFLISTPGVGVDSILLTSVLLGPLMALVRVGGALVTAIVTGLLVGLTRDTAVAAPAVSGGCCASSGCHDQRASVDEPSGLRAGLRYAFSDLLDDISAWMFAGLLLAGVLVTLVPPDTLVRFSGGLVALMLMAVVGIPLYICAAAATPVAAGLLLAGISPGMALVFLLAGPITSLATLAILRRELGTPALAVYLASVLCVTVLAGWLFDVAVGMAGWNPVEQARQVQELLPHWLGWLALAVLMMVAVRPIRRRLLGF